MSEKQEDWKHKRKIATLPGQTTSPQQVLARTLDKSGRIKSVVVLIEWDDNRCDFDWSSMKMSDLVWIERCFNLAVIQEMQEPGAEPEAVPPKAS